MNSAKVSIGMPVYNDKSFLKEALDSILSQTYTNFELIISDDFSTDGSTDTCIEYAEKDKRIRYIRQVKNIGISKNMEFLLKEAVGEYFMWAANDDLWNEDFVLILKNILERNADAACAFTAYNQIDERGIVLEGREFILEDYSGESRYERLRKLVVGFSDGFGYGLFRREKIEGVQFPIWWWINKKCAYNNIYPTLCFYLTKGNFRVHTESVLWNNRIKKPENIHHKIPFSNNFILAYFAYALRKLNLVCFSIWAIIKAEKGVKTSIQILPRILFSWFVIPVFKSPYKKYLKFKSDPSVFI